MTSVSEIIGHKYVGNAFTLTFIDFVSEWFEKKYKTKRILSKRRDIKTKNVLIDFENN